MVAQKHCENIATKSCKVFSYLQSEFNLVFFTAFCSSKLSDMESKGKADLRKIKLFEFLKRAH